MTSNEYAMGHSCEYGMSQDLIPPPGQRALPVGRLPMIVDRLAQGTLVEPFGARARVRAPYAYWLIVPPAAQRDAPRTRLMDWLLDEAAQTQACLAG